MQFFKNMAVEIIIRLAFNVCIFLITLLLIYLAFAFYTLHIDFRLWTTEIRGMFLYLGISLSLLVTGTCNLLD